MSCRNDGTSQRFSAGSCLSERIDRSLAIKINYVEAYAGSQADVGVGMCGPPWADHVEIGRSVIEPAAAIAS
jgi:hypothetical protein